ncbi:MAG TPA: alpha-L-fucosidase [Phnomibacter sp.]|nr:alpha-L-fucosidase [Phnomibacter sp.]
MKRFAPRPFIWALLLLAGGSFYSPVFCQRPQPTEAQLNWHDQEFYLFFHFGPNTFTGKEWGHGDEKEEIFQPTQLDTDQWCRISKAAGATGVIITAKHHDGFCLWPSKYSTHTVAQSSWRNGQGDVLKELAASCKKYDLKFGVYISPWDRNHPAYGTAAYNDVYINTMKEIFANYGPIWELWWDGANGEGPNGKKQEYDFPKFEKTIRSISPETVIFSDIGPDIRWVGNERGIAGTTNWNTLDTAGFKRGHGAPHTDTLNSGNAFGSTWIPAECDVSIRPGWFYHKEEDSKVKSGEQLFDLYLKSVGRGATLLLNVPPDDRGLIHANDSAALMQFNQLRHRFGANLAQKGKVCVVGKKLSVNSPTLCDGDARTGVDIVQPANQTIDIAFTSPEKLNCIILQEDISEGQSCAAFSIVLKDAQQNIIREIKGTTIGHKRILTFPAVEVAQVVLLIKDQHEVTRIGEISVHLIDENLVEKG